MIANRQPAGLPAGWEWACPDCQQPVGKCGCGEALPQMTGGIVRALTSAQRERLQPFMASYRQVRQREGWGSSAADYYRRLPAVSPGDPYAAIWAIRQRSLQALLSWRAVGLQRPGQRVLDLGAGNLWLTAILARQGQQVLAVDLSDDPHDGLGAAQHYELPLSTVQAEFDRLPLAAGQADVVIYNGAFHYSSDYAVTLREARRVLAPGGRIVVMDSPLYLDRRSGDQMVAERRAHFAATYDLEAPETPLEEYLTWSRLPELAAAVGLRWRVRRPFYSLERVFRPWRWRLGGGRERSTFALLLATMVEKEAD